MPSKPAAELTLHDRLSRLTRREAEELLGGTGADAARCLAKGGTIDIDIESHVLLDSKALLIAFPDYDVAKQQAFVSLDIDSAYRQRLRLVCSIAQAASPSRSHLVQIMR